MSFRHAREPTRNFLADWGLGFWGLLLPFAKEIGKVCAYLGSKGATDDFVLLAK
jgi:hypothetical protein